MSLHVESFVWQKEVRQAERAVRGRAAPSAMLQERFVPEDQAPTP